MDAPPKTPAAQSSTDHPMTDSPPKYVPQFSAATEMILKRINSGVGSTSLSSIGITSTAQQIGGYEEMRRRVMQGMGTSLSMGMGSNGEMQSEIPLVRMDKMVPGDAGKGVLRPDGTIGEPFVKKTPTKNGTPASGGKGKAAARPRGGRGTKRKRAKEESEESAEESDIMSKLGGDSESDAGSIMELPKITQSGRQVVKPAQFVPAVSESHARKRGPTKRTQEQALCKRCGRGHSPQSNMIVFCDGCNLGWHQMCHDPTVSDEAVKDETAPWYCLDCSRKRGRKATTATIEEPRGVSWQGHSEAEKRAYFYSLPHQNLVSLLMQAVTLQPNLPLFPHVSHAAQAFIPPNPQSASKQRTSAHSQQPFPPSLTAGLFTRAESNPNAPINFIRKIQPGGSNGSTPSASQPTFQHSSSAPPALPPQPGQEDSRESTPASPPYPKPGNGLMAKLGPDEDDMEWLVDGDDFEAFSHVVYDENGEKTEENGVPVNGGHA